jgi:hypothetical protein
MRGVWGEVLQGMSATGYRRRASTSVLITLIGVPAANAVIWSKMSMNCS